MKLSNINGILSVLSESSDFTKEYKEIGNILIFDRNTDSDDRFGVLIEEEESKKFVKVPVSFRSYLNIKVYMDSHTIQVPTSHGLFNILSNVYNINIICFFIKKVDNSVFYTYMVTEKDNEFFCSNVYFSDAVCITRTIKTNFLINNEIVSKLGRDIKSIKNYIF